MSIPQCVLSCKRMAGRVSLLPLLLLRRRSWRRRHYRWQLRSAISAACRLDGNATQAKRAIASSWRGWFLRFVQVHQGIHRFDHEKEDDQRENQERDNSLNEWADKQFAAAVTNGVKPGSQATIFCCGNKRRNNIVD